MGIEMEAFDRTILKNRTAAYLQKKTGKLDNCSIYLKKKKNAFEFLFTDYTHEKVYNGWAVYNSSFSKEKSSESIVFKDKEILKCIGWLISNSLFNVETGNISFDVKDDSLKIVCFEELIKEIYFLMKNDSEHDISVFSSDPLVNRIFLLIQPDNSASEDFPYRVALLTKNSWGEYFFNMIDLSGIENSDEKCYKISNVIYDLLKNVPTASIKYKISFLTNIPDGDIVKEKIESGLQQFRGKRGKAGEMENEIDGLIKSPDEPDESRPILDLL